MKRMPRGAAAALTILAACILTYSSPLVAQERPVAPRDAVAGAPPAFLAAGSLDECCAGPAVRLYEQLRGAKGPAELRIYAGAGHAFNLDESNRISVLHWPDRLADWLADEGWLDAKGALAATFQGNRR